MEVTQDQAHQLLLSRASLLGLALAHLLFPLGGLAASLIPLNKYEGSLLNTGHILHACDHTYKELQRKNSKEVGDKDSLDQTCFDDFIQEVTQLQSRKYAKSLEAQQCFTSIVKYAKDHSPRQSFIHYRAYYISQLSLELFRQNPSYFERPYGPYNRSSTLLASPLVYFSFSYFVSRRLVKRTDIKDKELLDEIVKIRESLKFTNWKHTHHILWASYKGMQIYAGQVHRMVRIGTVGGVILANGSLFYFHYGRYLSNMSIPITGKVSFGVE